LEECIASIFGIKNPQVKNQHEQVAADTCTCRFFGHRFFYPEDGGNMFLQYVG
jgi:hypothetical protein